MEIFQDMLGVTLGLILIYFVLSLVSSAISQLLMDGLEVKGVSLERQLRRIVGDRTEVLLNLPQIKALKPIRYKSWISIFGAVTEPKKVEHIPVPILVDAYIDLLNLADKKNRKIQELTKTINSIPESDAKQALLLWIRQGITNLDDLRAKLTLYFTGLLDQAVATANANARSFVVNLSIIIVLLLGTDTISLARDFWYLPTVREVFSTYASTAAEQESMTDLSNVLDELDSLSPSIGWPQLLRYAPSGGTLLDWILFVALRVLGLGITAIFVSQGSGFWFDVLSKLK